MSSELELPKGARAISARHSTSRYILPSAATIEPVIKLAASEARNRTTAAISSTSPIRPIGVLLIHVSNIALFCFAYEVIGVLI
jgi:hypothetical protein